MPENLLRILLQKRKKNLQKTPENSLLRGCRKDTASQFVTVITITIWISEEDLCNRECTAFSHEFSSVRQTESFILFHFLLYSFRQTLITQHKKSILKTILWDTNWKVYKESSKYTGLARKGHNIPLFWQNSFLNKIPHFSFKVMNSLFWNSGSNTS